MKKNIASSTETIKNKSIVFSTEKDGNQVVEKGFFYPSIIRSVTKITKDIVKAPKDNIHFKMKKTQDRNVFYIDSSRAVSRLYSTIISDLNLTTSFFYHYKANPYFEALTKAQEKIKNHRKLRYFFKNLPRELNQRCDFDEAKAMWYVCYLAIKVIRKFTGEKDFVVATNDFEKPVRQNARSLESYLKKLGKRYRNLTIAHQNLSLTDTTNFGLNGQKINQHRDRLVRYARLHMDQRILTDAKLNDANDPLYQILKSARTAHIRQLQNHPEIGSVLAGYVWRLNYNKFTYWSYDLVLFFDLSKSPNLLAAQLERRCNQLWLQLCRKTEIVQQSVTSPFFKKELATSLKFNTEGYNEAIQQLISALIRTDYLLRIVAPDKGRTFGKGQA